MVVGQRKSIAATLRACNAPRLRLSVIVLASMCCSIACSSTPGKAELPVLQRYQSIESYGSLSIEADGAIADPIRVADFVAMGESYARARGIDVISGSKQSIADSKIVISVAEKGDYLATLYRGERQLDQLVTAALDRRSAQQMIDELLLLWHPPANGNELRAPVPRYVLQPTSHEVSKDSFVSLVANNVENMNMDHQAWHQLQSRTPTFSWEAFPRAWDIPPGLNKEAFKNVRY